MGTVKLFVVLVRDILVAVGALACFLQWLGIEPGAFAFSAPTIPHWLWLVLAVALLAYLVYNSFRGRFVIAKEMNSRKPESISRLKIHSASWGNAQSRTVVREAVDERPRDSLTFFVNNDTFRCDPAEGDDQKYVEIVYSYGDGAPVTLSRPQGYRVVLPEDSWTKKEIQRFQDLYLGQLRESDALRVELKDALRQAAEWKAEVEKLNSREEKLRQAEAEAAKAQAKLLSTAPRFIVRAPTRAGMLFVTNDGPSAAANVTLGPLIHEEEHGIQILYAPFGSVLPRVTEERQIAVDQRHPNSGGSLWSAMRDVAMEPQPIDSVTLSFDDSNGIQFSQRFLLTSEVDGSVTWVPERVKLRPSSPGAAEAH